MWSSVALPACVFATLLFFLTYQYVAIFYAHLSSGEIIIIAHKKRGHRQPVAMEHSKFVGAIATAAAAKPAGEPHRLEDELVSLGTLNLDERRKSTAAEQHHPYRRERVARQTLGSTSSGSSHPDHHDHQPSEATVKEHYPFNAGDDAKTLYKAMEGLGNSACHLCKSASVFHRKAIHDDFLF